MLRIFCAQMLVIVAATAYAENLRVRVVDAKTGSPVKGVAVEMALNGGPGREPHRPVPNSSRSALTDSSGYASFAIGPERKRYITVAFPEQCAAEKASFSIQQILETGVAVENHCYHHNSRLKRVKAAPGDILFFRDQLNFFERLAHARDAQ